MITLLGGQYQPQIGEFYDSSLVNNTGEGNILIHHTDGTFEYIPKSPAYILGERVLRPMIDGGIYCVNQLVAGTIKVCSVIDTVISHFVPAFPGAAAKEVPVENQNEHNKLELLRGDYQSVKVWKEIGVDPRNAGTYIENLPLEDKVKLSLNGQLQNNFQDLHAIFLDLSKFISNQAFAYETYRGNLIDACRTLRYLENDLNHILNDLKFNRDKSRFSPTSGKISVVTFPSYSADFRERKKKGSFYQVDIGSKKDREIIPPMASAKEFLEIHAECHDNPVENAMLAQLAASGGLLKIFNLRNNYKYEQFKVLFGDESLNNLRSQIVKMKKNLLDGTDSVEKIVGKYIQSQQKKIEDDIQIIVNLIYEEQRKIAGTTRKMSVKAQNPTGLVTDWEVIHEGRFFNTKSSRFRVGDSVPLEDEC